MALRGALADRVHADRMRASPRVPADVYAPCTDTTTLRSRVPTRHDSDICNFQYSPPPAPSPNFPPGALTQEVVKISFVSAGDVTDYGTEKEILVSHITCTAVNVPDTRCRTKVAGASVKMDIEIATENADGNTIQTAISSHFGTPDAATSFLSGAGVQVLSAPEIGITQAIVAQPPSPPQGAPVGAIIGGVLGGIIGVLMVGAVVMMYMKRKKATAATYPA